ncbi:hypothetical protein A3B21_03305 [Candidatus Uhrbacteria bacterium RIFCSPLOWO2_01_FULL_47_24]|uniref:Four helix bundle protein n=1 Tax=Candidatus Uhrbacteria bacterium RIFCSPLOWO2_01_FULL_47_24 TaxID=1802401 RepID=A0A1F7UP78_9BACT|nr:MAG: hypothetical protein A2753_02865 [Candidatus Uhrbacteria bacterium RIFCSPHIGHO2_01_FULL_47_11]OGL68377.1 MAG: hypothetical protein A3D58_04365 [Candidatus Uhrbacteria bacterium RIFCSPHIGHO2_02_FULL_46_47]OGL75711.1 MAG: hypothetical protein A3F52_02255 [Candidatus Uhrbacteria bacterium RIFCSPHIGHO2_12_FULL_47_11]OGL80045.1 MAG: hypothetical protein A3B21_03305 [Candidatus Uhrbacteria bacterium RIFCSPLOWO2_01_FULL_47_24]OGL84511.1 MAG: hypothetical protein A3J03_01685 [Candidatus Uhrbact
MELGDLEVYQLAREISRDVWVMYDRLDWHDKKITGDQWIRAIDSVGANLAEGFGRFHYLDKNKFNYNARGSLQEARHWTDILREHKKITDQECVMLISKLDKLNVKINNYISATRNQVK